MSDTIAKVLLDYAKDFVKVPRTAIDTLASDPLTMTVFAVIVSRARWNAGAVLRGGHGVVGLQPGQALIGREELARVCNTTSAKIRTSLSRLVTLGFLTTESTSKGTIATVVNYAGNGDASSVESPTGSPESSQRSTSASPPDSPLTKKGEGKKEKERRKKLSSQLPADWSPRQEEIDLAVSLHLDANREAIRFTGHHTAKGTTFKDWHQAFANWIRRAPEFKTNGWQNSTASGRFDPSNANHEADLADEEKAS